LDAAAGIAGDWFQREPGKLQRKSLALFKEPCLMSHRKTVFSWMVICLAMLAVAQPRSSQAETLHGGVVVVPENKLPAEARQPGVAMHLHWINPDTPYLYVEQDQGRRIAVFDVSDPGKVKLERVVVINARAPFDFLHRAGEFSLVIRYRDGSGTALLDLRHPKEPRVTADHAPSSEDFVVPVVRDVAINPPRAQDFQILTPSATPAMTVKGVVQEEVNQEDGTIYLLGAQGLTVIRNIQSERRLAAMAPPFTSN
jgi:hypothetical protein